jgi:hypothetical protein
VVDIAALDMTATKTSGGGDMRVGASSAQARVATVDEVAIIEAEIRVDRDSVQVVPHMPVLETEQAYARRWGVPSLQKFCGRALIEFVRKGGTLTCTCQMTVSADNGMSEGSGGNATGSSGCRAGW